MSKEDFDRYCLDYYMEKNPGHHLVLEQDADELKAKGITAMLRDRYGDYHPVLVLVKTSCIDQAAVRRFAYATRPLLERNNGSRLIVMMNRMDGTIRTLRFRGMNI